MTTLRSERFHSDSSPSTASHLLLAALCALILLPRTAHGHAGWEFQTRRLDPTRPDPVVDGICDPSEYIGATKYSIIYSDRYPGAEPAMIQAVNKSDYLYICVSGLPYRPDLQRSTCSVYIDKYHDGGKTPYPDDFRLDIEKTTGALAAYRGNGAGAWVHDDASVPGWTAAQTACCGDFKLTWTAEFQIPLSLIGGDIAPTGIQIRHSSVRFSGDDYGWPPTGAATIPNTWGDIHWIFPGSGPPKAELDVATVTDGLEFDLTGGVKYDLIAGKDALVRAQLFTSGELRKIASAECRFQLLTPGPGPVQTIAAETTPAPGLNPGTFGYFKGAAPINCWIPGTMLETPGNYRFELAVTLEGTTVPQVITLGNYSFLPTGDLRLLLAPITLPTAHPNFLAWDSDLSALIFSGLYEVQRMWPLRNSVGLVLKSGAPGPSSHGLRVSFLGIDSCPGGLDPNPTNAWAICDGDKHKSVILALQRYNAEAKKANAADGMRRDLFDKADILYAVNTSGGGRCCSPIDVAEGGMDKRNLQGQIIAHEIAHSIQEVKPASPHSAPGDAAHSRTGPIPLKLGFPMIHTRFKSEVGNPLATMNPGWAWSIVDSSARGIQEGWEWNDLRRTMMTLGSFAPSAAPAALVQIGPRLVVAGLIDQDNISHVFSARYDNLDLNLTPPAPNGVYALVLRAASGAEVGRFPFALDSPASSDGDNHPFIIGAGRQDAPIPAFHVTIPLPNTASFATIEKQNATLHTISFSQQPPTVANVVATPNPQIPGRVLVSWTAQDPDSPRLQYNVLFKARPDDLPMMVASGLGTPGYSLSTEFAPASSNATVIIEASDGYHTAQAASGAFSIPARAPIARIDSPAPGATLVAGQRVTLVGLGYDTTDGLLDGAALTWMSEQNTVLGRGARLDARLTAGQHVLTLIATASSGQSAQAGVPVLVLADSDGDGLPDNYEVQFQCMSPNVADSDQDPDGDGLTNLEEYLLGTNPCNPDSDNDGIADGDEARLGSNPLDPQSRPEPELLFTDRNHVELVGCPEMDTVTLFVQAANPQINWRAVSTADWLVLSGSGPGDQDLVVRANCQQLPEGIYRGLVILTTDSGQSRTIDVSLTIPPLLQLSAQIAGQEVRVAFWAADGKRYQIEVTDSLTAPIPWRPMGAAILGTGEFANVALPIPPNSPQQFYRVLRFLNDNFINRAPLGALPVTVSTASVGATKEPGEPNHANGDGNKSLWWSWTAPGNGPVTISTIGSDFDTVLGVYTGSMVTRLSLIAADDDSGGNRTSRVSFNAQAGTIYQIAVDGYRGASGNIRLNITSP